jgi:hypothetical protein
MGHRIKVLQNFVEPADAEKVIRLIDEGKSNSITTEWMLKKYSDKLLEEHREELGWKSYLFTAKAQAFPTQSGSEPVEYTNLGTGLEHIIATSIIYLGGNFTDGKIVFPNQEFEYQPEPLSAIIFPSGSWEYRQSLEPVTSGVRYEMAMLHTGYYQKSLQQKYLQENNISLSNLWSANFKNGVCGI